MRFGLYAYPVYGKRATNAAEGLELAIKAFGELVDIFVGPEYANVSEADAQRLGEKLAATSNPARKLLIPGSAVVKEDGKVYNRVFVVDQEGVVDSYDQRNHCVVGGMNPVDHYDGDTNEVILGSGRALPIFRHGTQQIGVDVCVDNSDKFGAPVLDGVGDLDYHVIVASGMSTPAAFRGRHTLFVEGGGADLGRREIRPYAAVWRGRGQHRVAPEKVVPIGMETSKDGVVLDKLYVFDLK